MTPIVKTIKNLNTSSGERKSKKTKSTKPGEQETKASGNRRPIGMPAKTLRDGVTRGWTTKSAKKPVLAQGSGGGEVGACAEERSEEDVGKLGGILREEAN